LRSPPRVGSSCYFVSFSLSCQTDLWVASVRIPIFPRFPTLLMDILSPPSIAAIHLSVFFRFKVFSSLFNAFFLGFFSFSPLGLSHFLFCRYRLYSGSFLRCTVFDLFRTFSPAPSVTSVNRPLRCYCLSLCRLGLVLTPVFPPTPLSVLVFCPFFSVGVIYFFSFGHAI